MTTMPTLGVLSIIDGRLMGDIGDVYKVLSFLIGRDIFTHEIPKYGRMAEPILAYLFPDMEDGKNTDWEMTRDYIIHRHGDTVDIPDSERGCLSDGKSPIDNIKAIKIGE